MIEPSILVALVLVIAAFLSLELGISSAILEIVAGAIVALFLADIHSLEWLTFLANMGMLGLMFMAGFEVEARRLRKTWKASAGIGVLSLLLPMAGVYALVRFGFGMEHLPAGLIAVGLSTTSLALVYHALKDREFLDGRTGQTILAAASVVDVLSMIALAILLGDAGWGTAIFLLVAIPVLIGLPKVGEWLFARYEDTMEEFELRFLLVVLMGLGFMAEEVRGIHPAVVAFAVGLVMSEVVSAHEQVEEKLKGIVFSFFAPVFFLHAGTRLDLRLFDLELLGFAGILFVVACGLKFVGTALPARIFLRTSGAFTGLLFNYRLSFGIIAATVGFSTGALSEDLYAALLMVVVASAALPVIFLGDRPSEIGGRRSRKR